RRARFAHSSPRFNFLHDRPKDQRPPPGGMNRKTSIHTRTHTHTPLGLGFPLRGFIASSHLPLVFKNAMSLPHSLRIIAIHSRFLLALPLALSAATPAPVDTGDPNDGQALITTESPAQIARRLQWWSDARFGMFIHWGLYAQDGCFWKGQDGKTEHMMRHLQIPIAEYEKIAAEFNPAKFNADEWVRIAQDAGMKYLIITSKHHDGFAMFDSPSDNYNIVKRTPFKRDAVRELAEACRQHGLKFGVYYSLGRDWHDPDVPTSVKADGKRRSNTWDFPDEDKKDFSKYFE